MKDSISHQPRLSIAGLQSVSAEILRRLFAVGEPATGPCLDSSAAQRWSLLLDQLILNPGGHALRSQLSAAWRTPEVDR